MKLQRTSILLIALLLLAASPASARKWTSSSGKFSVEAKLVEIKDGNVRLQRQDGKIITVPVSKLSKTDRVHLSSLAQAKKKTRDAGATEDEVVGDTKVVQADIAKLWKATRSGDVDTVFALTPPLIIKKMGGEEKAKSIIKAGFRKNKAIGLKLGRITFPAKPTFFKTDKNYFAIVPIKNIISAKRDRVETMSFQLGIRAIGKKNWTYMEGSKINQGNVRLFFPDFPRNVKFPKTIHRDP